MHMQWQSHAENHLFYWNTSCMFCSFRPTSSDIKRPVVLGQCPCLNWSGWDTHRVCMDPKTVDCTKTVQSCNARALELQIGCRDCCRALLSAVQSCRRCGPLPGLCSLRNSVSLSCLWHQGPQKTRLPWQRSHDLWFFQTYSSHILSDDRPKWSTSTCWTRYVKRM